MSTYLIYKKTHLQSKHASRCMTGRSCCPVRQRRVLLKDPRCKLLHRVSRSECERSVGVTRFLSPPLIYPALETGSHHHISLGAGPNNAAFGVGLLPHPPKHLQEIHQHQRRQSWNPAGVGVNSAPRPACVIHLLANIVLWVSLKAQLLNELQNVCLGAGREDAKLKTVLEVKGEQIKNVWVHFESY